MLLGEVAIEAQDLKPAGEMMALQPLVECGLGSDRFPMCSPVVVDVVYRKEFLGIFTTTSATGIRTPIVEKYFGPQSPAVLFIVQPHRSGLL
jgi:hypothetical protein